MIRKRLYLSTAIAVSSCLSVSLAQAITTPSLRTVALLSDQLPGVPADVVIEQFASPRVDISGRVAFKARLLKGVGGTNFSNETAIWSEVAAGDLRFVARQGDPILGLDYIFDEVEPGENLRMSAGGQVYFVAGMSNVSNPFVRSSGIFRFDSTNGLTLVTASSPIGDPSIPTLGNPGEFFTNFFDFSEAGDIAMQTGTGFGPVFALGSVSGLNQVTSSGSFPAINEQGEVALRTGGGNNDRITVWNPAAPLRTVAAESTIAPQTGGASFFQLALRDTFTNATGVVTFAARLAGSGVGATNDFGIWSETNPGGPVALIMREGNQAPGLNPGIVWSGFDPFSESATVGRNGGIALRLGLSGPGVGADEDSGVWAGTEAAGFHLLAREGDPAPGTEPGTVFSLFTSAGAMPDGRGVFSATLTGPGVDPEHDSGVWAEGIDGLLYLIVRRGDSVQLPSGIDTQLSFVLLDPSFGVSERGHIAILGGLSAGGIGVFVSDFVAVPEPCSLIQLALALPGASTAAWRKKRKGRRKGEEKVSGT